MSPSAIAFPEVLGTMRTMKEIEAIKSIELPPFKVPYPSRMNVGAAEAIAETYRWMSEHSMDADYNEKALKICIESDFPSLSCRVYVDAAKEELAWVSKLMLWFFLLDNHMDDIDPHEPERADSMILEMNLVFLWTFPDDSELRKNFLSVVDEWGHVECVRAATLEYVNSKLLRARLYPATVYDVSELGPMCHPLVKGLRDLWVTVISSMPDEFNTRWAQELQLYINEHVVEIKNRRKNKIPSISEHIFMRRNTIGMNAAMVAVGYVCKVYVPEYLLNCHEMQRVFVLANDIVTWHNDIWSFKKEVLQGDVHNLVIVISNERGCFFSEAMEMTYKMLTDRMEDFARAIKDMERVTPLQYKHAVSEYIKTAQFWISGTYDWHLRNVRYQV